jgi:hypothetical protein
MKKDRKQANQYDKIFKENIEAVIPSLMQNVLGITAISMEELPDDVQHTKERKPDVLKKVTDSQGNIFVLQIEFQVADEPEMVYRMAEYYIMLERKYKIPVQQFVIISWGFSSKDAYANRKRAIQIQLSPFFIVSNRLSDFCKFR